MAFVIAEACIDVKDGACVKACPVDCIEGGPDDPQYYIDPDRCIDCDVCATVCPVHAIYRDTKLPPESAKYLDINREYFQHRPGA